MLLGALALAFAAGLFLARRMVVPIQALRAGAARLGSGDLGQRITIKTGDEVEALADQFNDMAGRLQESYANLEQKVEARTHELSEALEQQTATSEVLQVISSSPGDLQPVFASMLENAVRICDATFGNIYRWDGDAFSLLATHKTPPAFAEARRRSPLSPGSDTPLGRMVANKAVIHLADAVADPSYAEQRDPAAAAAVEIGGARAAVLVPMLSENELIGSFSVFRKELRPFTDKQIDLVKSFAAQAVIAIENTRLLTELRESLEQQTATSEVLRVISSSPGNLEPVFASMLEKAVAICDAKFGNIYRWDDNALHLARHLQHTAGFRRNAPVFSANASGRFDGHRAHAGDQSRGSRCRCRRAARLWRQKRPRGGRRRRTRRSADDPCRADAKGRRADRRPSPSIARKSGRSPTSRSRW